MTLLAKNDYKVLYDPSDYAKATTSARQKALRELMNENIPAFQYARRSIRGAIIRSKLPTQGARWLIGADSDFVNVVPPDATHRGFDSRGQAIGWYSTSPVPKGWKLMSNDFSSTSTTLGPLIISDYYTGKVRTVTDGATTYQCRITIDSGVWQVVESMKGGIGISQIKGILTQDPILVTNKSKQQGVRCIKPEPYGWIFSTSVANRLTDTSTDPRTTRPTSLTFDSIERGH